MKSHVWIHNSHLGRVVRSRNFLQSLMSASSITADGKYHIERVLTHLNALEEELRRHRVEPSGETVRIKR